MLSRANLLEECNALAIDIGEDLAGTSSESTGTAPYSNLATSGANGYTKENGTNDTKRATNGVANGNGVGIYFDDDLCNATVQDLLTG